MAGQAERLAELVVAGEARLAGPGVRWGGQVRPGAPGGRVCRCARGSWTVAASRSSIDRGIGCFCWVSCGGLGQFFSAGVAVAGDGSA